MKEPSVLFPASLHTHGFIVKHSGDRRSYWPSEPKEEVKRGRVNIEEEVEKYENI
jgi:hypothetical protein